MSFGSILCLRFKWIFELRLFASPGEYEPTVERGSAPLATSTGPDSEGRCHPLYDVAEPDILLVDKPRQASAEWLVGCLFATGWLFLHLAFADSH
jgi:hypothetical protein